MRLALSCALLASALLGLSACNKAESPETRSVPCPLPTLSQVYGGGPMLFDFSEPERNTARRALEIYV
jgi:hypothetical protein